MFKKFDTLGYTSKDAGLRGNYREIIAEITKQTRSHAPAWNAYERSLMSISLFLHAELKYVFPRRPWEQGCLYE